MHQNIILLILAIVVIVIIVISFELGYIIYLMNSDAADVNHLLHKNRRHHRIEDFNPERNYPQPPNSIIRDDPVDLYYAAGNTEVPNDITHIRDDYYAKQVKHF